MFHTYVKFVMASTFTFVWWTAQAAQPAIHKCLADGRTRYQNAPCSTHDVALPFRDSSSDAIRVHRRNGGESAPSTKAEPAGSAASADILEQWHRGELALGMSDTIVLNRPHWGRPHTIVRDRARDGYREVWTYAADARGVSRVLSFLNGQLVEIRRDPDPVVAIQENSNQVVTDSPSSRAALRADPRISVTDRPSGSVDSSVVVMAAREHPKASAIVRGDVDSLPQRARLADSESAQGSALSSLGRSGGDQMATAPIAANDDFVSARIAITESIEDSPEQ